MSAKGGLMGTTKVGHHFFYLPPHLFNISFFEAAAEERCQTSAYLQFCGNDGNQKRLDIVFFISRLIYFQITQLN